jgi:hypothetical protein
MADDVEITAGSGTIIKTDQVGTDHVQYVKLMDGTADGTGVIAGSAAKGIDVDVTRIANNIDISAATGTGAITLSKTAATKGDKLVMVSLHLSSVTGTSEAFTATLDANAGAAYDTLLLSVNPCNLGITDYVWIPDQGIYLDASDAIDLA